MLHEYIKKIINAPVYDVAIQSPLEQAKGLSAKFGHKIWLKREDLQPVFSFKLRGAYNKMATMGAEALGAGVIAASAGNHAQGVALSAKKLKTKAVIVMPVTTPEIKVKAVQNFGAEVVLHGDAYDDACAHAKDLAKQRGLAFIHPYDDADVIAGQGTVAMEILRQHTGRIGAIFVPVGGGGLVAGVAAYVKFARPDIMVVGVEPRDSDCLYQALAAGKRVQLPQVGLFADGVAVRQVGEEPFRVARKHVDEVIRVDTDEICAAIKDIFSENRSVAEPAGALGVAGIKRYLKERGLDDIGDMVAVISGANINFDRLRHVAERAAVGEKREILLAVTLPEKAGSLLKFCSLLGKRGITEFNYRYFDDSQAKIFVGIQVHNRETEREQILKRLNENGFASFDMTDNDLAKEHIRYMVGGRPPHLLDEVVYSFEFPERPGALLGFLSSMRAKWNISMFHYRNHGAAYGRVLMGLQVPLRERKELKRFVESSGFEGREETDNPAYLAFLREN